MRSTRILFASVVCLVFMKSAHADPDDTTVIYMEPGDYTEITSQLLAPFHQDHDQLDNPLDDRLDGTRINVTPSQDGQEGYFVQIRLGFFRHENYPDYNRIIDIEFHTGNPLVTELARECEELMAQQEDGHLRGFFRYMVDFVDGEMHPAQEALERLPELEPASISTKEWKANRMQYEKPLPVYVCDVMAKFLPPTCLIGWDGLGLPARNSYTSRALGHSGLAQTLYVFKEDTIENAPPAVMVPSSLSSFKQLTSSHPTDS